MRKLTILAATLLMLSPAASAQITAGPVGPFAMVDADGDLMGGANFVESGEWQLTLDTPAGRGFIIVFQSSSMLHLNSFAASGLYFVSSNCTGQPYAISREAGIDGGPSLMVNQQTLYSVADLPTNITVGSRLASGGCDLVGGIDGFFPATAVGNLATRFTPPFRIVTAASQTASVPMLGRMTHWLLAAVLVGCFVLYDRRRLAAITP